MSTFNPIRSFSTPKNEQYTVGLLIDFGQDERSLWTDHVIAHTPPEAALKAREQAHAEFQEYDAEDFSLLFIYPGHLSDLAL